MRKSPQVLITVALEEDRFLDKNNWLEWLASVPAVAKAATVEGIYKSNSTLLLLTIPVTTWNLLPENPAVKFLGFVRLKDLLKSSPSPDLTS